MSSGEPTVKELAWSVASELLEANHFVTIEDQSSREIFRYDAGVYAPDGEAYIKQKVQENFEVKEDVSTHLVNEVAGHVERSTIKPRSIFDETNPHLVLQNGLLNLSSLELEPFTPDYYALNKLPVAFDPSKGCPGPVFQKFITEILPSHDIQGVQEELGAILRKKYLTKKFSIYLGDTDTGKTTLISVFTALLGQESVSSVSIQDLASKNPFFLAQLYGKMANIRDDVSKDIVYSVGKIKELTGGYRVNAQKKHRDPFDFYNYAYLLFTCNTLPPIEEDDAAFFNRVMLRYFTNRFGGREGPDRDLVSKLTTPDELSGVLNWGIEGLKRLQANGWNFTNTST
ncbi:MAG: hypothetical protein JRN03_07695, partial [Nitrososphaerota archaeon]|nr:hypothetical protein [Nitrososphaerota archaeon]